MFESPLEVPLDTSTDDTTSNKNQKKQKMMMEGEGKSMIRRNHSMQEHYCLARPPPRRRGIQRRLSASSSSSVSPLIGNRKRSTEQPLKESGSSWSTGRSSLWKGYNNSSTRSNDIENAVSSADPLGGSLHSSLNGMPHQPRRMLRGDREVTSSNSNRNGGGVSPQRGLLRQRSGSRRSTRRRGRSFDADDIVEDVLATTTTGPKQRHQHHSPELLTKKSLPLQAPPPPPSIHHHHSSSNNSPVREFRKTSSPSNREFRKFHSNPHADHGGMCGSMGSCCCGDDQSPSPPTSLLCCHPAYYYCRMMTMMPSPSYKENNNNNNNNKKKRWIFLASLQLSFWIVLGGALWMHSNHKVHIAHQALEASHLEKSDILAQMAWLDSRAKQNMMVVDDGDGNGSDNGSDNGASLQIKQQKQQIQYQQRRMDAMETHIRNLEQTLQDSARERLEKEYHYNGRTSMTPPEVELIMEDAKEPLVIQLWHDEMPYTTLAWLDQIRMGMWRNANLQHVDTNWIDIHPTTTTTNTNTNTANANDAKLSRLAFMEGALSSPEQDHNNDHGDRRFVLGMRNPQGHENMFVLTIHLEVGTCESDENEVCFGELVGGFDELADMDMENHVLTSVEISNNNGNSDE